MLPPTSGRPERRRPSRSQVALRRLLAGGLLVVFFGFALWLGVSALGGSGGEDDAAPATTTAAPAEPVLRVVFPEGFDRKQMVARVGEVRNIARERRKITPKLTAKGYLAATEAAKVPPQFRKDARGIEGFLFPATYEFTRRTSSTVLVSDQLELFRARWNAISLRYAKSKNLTPYDVLIIASMIEKETVAPEERRLVAAVIYNRLRLGMSLGIDATIRYGRGVPGTEPLKQSDLESDDPYNTRRRVGLPPTPIANPGLASIRAAANPARVDFLFFVRKPDGVHHFFTASESEFFRKKCEYGFGC